MKSNTMKKLTIFIFLITIFGNVEAVERYYLPVQDGTIVLKSRQILLGEMGKREQGYNRGKFIRDYAMSVWNKPLENYYYCMAGQYWTYFEAIRLLNFPASANPLMKTAHCLTQLNFAKKNYILKENYFPKIDDILIWAKGSSGHTGRITAILDSTKWIVHSAEMNTSLAKGQDERNGNGNGQKKRYLKLPLNRMKLKGVINFKVVRKK